MFGVDEEDEQPRPDGEGTIGMGKLLALFFAVVLLCAAALGIGYSLGRSAMRKQMAVADPTPATAVPCAPGAEKPSAAQTAPATPADMTFYNSVKDKDSNPQLTPPEQAAPGAAAAPAPAPAPVPVAAKPATLGAGYMVQIAAVKRKEDAALLREQLTGSIIPWSSPSPATGSTMCRWARTPI